MAESPSRSRYTLQVSWYTKTFGHAVDAGWISLAAIATSANSVLRGLPRIGNSRVTVRAHANFIWLLSVASGPGRVDPILKHCASGRLCIGRAILGNAPGFVEDAGLDDRFRDHRNWGGW